MGYEDALYDAESLGESISELISDLNTASFYSDEEVIAQLIYGLLKNFTKEGRESILDIVYKIMSNEDEEG